MKFPRPSLKGWLHLLLFLAFFSIMLTSLTWILWTQFSTSRAAQSERESKEITYAYVINGGFIIMALIGLYLDSFGQCRTYYRKWSLMNQELIILPYDMKKDTDYCTLLSSPYCSIFSTSPTFCISRTSAASTQTTSANKSTNAEPRDGTNSMFHENSGFAQDVEIFKNPVAMETHAEPASHQHQWPIMATSCVVITPDPHNILVLKETYV